MSFDTVIGLVAIFVAVFSVVLAIVFYFKADRLYKEMLKFIVEIRTYSESPYKDTTGMVKEAWSKMLDKERSEKIEEAEREKDKIKEEISAGIEKIKNLNIEGVTSDQLKEEMTKVETRFSQLIEGIFERIEKLDRDLAWSIKERIENTIIDIMDEKKQIKAHDLIDIIRFRFRGVSIEEVIKRIYNIRKSGLIFYEGPLEPHTIIICTKR